jgi:hypothetical protein
MLDRFKGEFATLGIHTIDDMPAWAVPTELHLRSGASLAELQQLAKDDPLSAYRSLTDAKLKALPTQRDYGSFLGMVEAFESFYKQRYPLHWTKLADWFATFKGSARKAGLP